ncbi:MAG: type 1 glutamine amidotransferase-like domain-containing protein [Anaerolineae bacterium]|jgi:cyanophycinase|nr:type 1 glutamine amidotransferase-like domain-containing protein [Anaerolineae bacterium]MBT3714355.1 type 1 glutamine amidotransferase-like domain-containing protein [Anaerolineae bacterium]MBT4310245.1 type 1 glutamine amidotransferase-like domain-containing protein [Anaerolineae bacterium]MBT4460229.1 type 1 glutamine amidotransferase-like domain-containing protein [Anaerolineae bacterium]MBT4842176.1 type 1 glutamine amidotransferase-like domain-containing protein [Anaerolineae bacterium
MGYLLLEGGAEFGGAMREPDLCAIELVDGFDAPICIIPTAAARDNNHLRAGKNGVRWFKSLGAADVESVSLINRESANDLEIADMLRAAKLIYMLGGFTDYLGKTLRGSKAWEAILEAYQKGAVIAGSSAGAMVMCEHYYDPAAGKVEQGLGLLQNACVLPHHNTFGQHWAAKLMTLLPDVTLLGIDEYTGMLSEGVEWQVLGGGSVTLYRDSEIECYKTGQTFVLDTRK